MAALVLGLAVIGVGLVRPTRVAELRYQGRTLHVPLGTWSTRMAAREGSARYLGLGDPRFASTDQLEVVEQLGSGHLLRGEGLRVEIVTRKRSRWLTEISIEVSTVSEDR